MQHLQPSPDILSALALQSAAPIVLALQECDSELQTIALELFQQLASGDLDEVDRHATTVLLAEILFPNSDAKGYPGLDLEEIEKLAPSQNAEAAPTLAQMDKEESRFAERLRECMERQNITQTELAEKVGIGQSAISMMLNRNCRPQKKTIKRFAEALGVPPGELWPGWE